MEGKSVFSLTLDSRHCNILHYIPDTQEYQDMCPQRHHPRKVVRKLRIQLLDCWIYIINGEI